MNRKGLRNYGPKLSHRNSLRRYRNFAGPLPTRDNERRKINLVFIIREAPDFQLLQVSSARAYFDYEILYFIRTVTHITYGATEAQESRTRTLHLFPLVPWVYEFDSLCSYNTVAFMEEYRYYYYYYYYHHHLLLLLYAVYLYIYSWDKLCP